MLKNAGNEDRNHSAIGGILLPRSENVEIAKGNRLEAEYGVKDLALILADELGDCIR